MKKIFFFFFVFLLFPSLSLASSHLLIVEVQIQGEESSNDFIKIYNPTENNIDITGFQLKKRSSTGKEYSLRVFPKGSEIPAYGYFIWANSKNNFAQTIGANIESTATLSKNNSIALLDKEKNIVDALCWGTPQNPFQEGECFSENPGKNQRLIRKKTNGKFQDTNNNKNDFFLSPSQESPETKEEEIQKEESIFTTSTSSPVAIAGPDIISQVGETIHFDGSKSYDPDKDHLFYFWNFGDGSSSKETSPVHSYEFPGKYTVVLEVSDGKNKSQDQILVTILPKNIVISEFSPKEGWIELWNKNPYPIDLSGWQIKNNDEKFTFPQSSIIFPNQFLIIPKESLGFSLSQKGSLSLLFNENSPFQEIDYQEGRGESVFLDSQGNFLWTSLATPSTSNFQEGKTLLSNFSTYQQKAKNENKETISLVVPQKNSTIPKESSISQKELQNFSASSSLVIKNKFLLLLAFFISFIFAFIVLILKKVSRK